MTERDPTPPVSDLELMAHADGELPPMRAAEVEQALQRDAALNARHGMYRRSRVLARAAQAEALDEPVPPALLAAVRRAAAAGAAQTPSPTPPSTGPARAAPAANAPRYALVASVAALAAGLIGFVLRGQVDAAAGPTLAATPAPAGVLAGPLPREAQHRVAEALARQPSGPGQSLADGARLVVIASYRDRSGRLCREFRWDAPAPTGGSGLPPAEGLACHAPAGTAGWQLVALAQAGAPADGSFRPAGGGLLDQVASEIGAGPVLSEADEARALATLDPAR